MVFPGSDCAKTALMESGDNLVFNHSAFGAEKLRHSVNLTSEELDLMGGLGDTTTTPKSEFRNKKLPGRGTTSS